MTQHFINIFYIKAKVSSSLKINGLLFYLGFTTSQQENDQKEKKIVIRTETSHQKEYGGGERKQ